MVKQVFTTSYDRIKEEYKEAGYEMPRLIFRSLAVRATENLVTVEDTNTALVSLYSQGMVRAFSENGAFDEGEDFDGEDVTWGEEAAENEGMTKEMRLKRNMEPMELVKKAVENQAYSMLEIMD
ncbi:hypothetical protein T440DRAFT_559051 [Plenodomus tracheiphilus IPT5]|uniref:DUF7788 domain-containing protein n=1 Tax=Plenodomus tracheiphilus IPT5 TaxID=1408161 RepID=A0A6A7AQ34_9PLEO|nr:hypothetical protein T440DRAFT_559051 [Plenodomus tracheiphilus IPT5]